MGRKQVSSVDEELELQTYDRLLNQLEERLKKRRCPPERRPEDEPQGVNGAGSTG